MNLYHFVPKNMQGSVLYPLNELKESMPEVCKAQFAKYEGRESKVDIEIPGLGRFNDVIHLSPIDPAETKAELKKAGASIDWPWKLFVIDSQFLDQDKLVIYVPKLKNGKIIRDFLPFNKENYRANCHIPELTKNSYREYVSRGEQPFTYDGAPHVFYGGSIDTTNLKIVEY